MKSYGGPGLTTITWPTVLPPGPASAQSSNYVPRVEELLHAHAQQCESCLQCLRRLTGSFTPRPHQLPENGGSEG